ncbi:hypothetical protein LINGRAHAP2_LOCUS31999 [Linum grandiflorum]
MPSFCFPFVVVDSNPCHLCWQGTRIQGDTLRPFAAYLESNVSVGSVYDITGFTLQPPHPSYRACCFPHWLALGPAAKYELLPPDTASAFAPESYEFVPSAKFPGCLSLNPVRFVDFVGKVIALGKPNHVSRGSGVAPVQTIVVVDVSGLEVEVSLWSELSNVLDVDTIPLDDMSNPVIVAFLGFQIRTYMGKTTTSSGMASRIIQDPLHPAAESLRVHFAGQERSVRCSVPKFDSPEKLTKHVQESYRTILELDGMYIAIGDSCSSAVVPYGSDFWCKKHDTVPSAAVAHRYRLKLLVSDSTSTSTFVLLGHAANRIMPNPASELVVAYPDDYGAPPPPLQMMIGQKVVFGVHLPRHVHASSYEDFKISKILGSQHSSRSTTCTVATSALTPTYTQSTIPP